MGSMWRGLCGSCLVVCFMVTISHSSLDTPDVDYHATGRPPPGHEDKLAGRRFFMHEIFSKYGDGGKITFDGFEHLLQSLGLANIIIRDHDLDSHKEEKSFRDMHPSHEHSQDGSGQDHSTGHSFEVVALPMKKHTENHPTHNTTPKLNHTHTSMTASPTPHDHDHDHETSHKKCLSATELLYAFDITPRSALNENNFLLLCPAIVYELDQGHCAQHQDHEIEQVTYQQWLYSSLAVLLISLCGLFSVAVIPIMQKWFYHTMLQFLVGLAVGSLSGDGLLHLLPHAMIEHESGHQHGRLPSKPDEQLMVWRGMAALGGIFFFFVAERLLESFNSYRIRRREAKASQPFVMTHPGGPNGVDEQVDLEVGEKLSHYRKNSYGLKIGADRKESIQMLPQEPPSSRKSSLQSNHEVGFHGRSSFSLEPDTSRRMSFSTGVDRTVTVSEHHGHGHGHTHEVPQSVSAVAWMVIMGDGLHNFCDGLAIGAAFAASTAGGLSTTVAVFCHELPHELGDFAMLLKTGMKVRQALLYNGLSSVLCFIGMLIGLSLGKVESATSWVFAGTAGMFLYIALVDMLPELSTTSNEVGTNATYTLAVQVLGISIGVSIMLMIAIFEPQLLEMFS